MALLAEVIREPTFPEEELETLKQEIMSQLMISEKEPSYQASREFDRLVYGSHPYSRPLGGSLKDVERLSAEDVSTWWKTWSRPDASVLYIAGDVDPVLFTIPPDVGR